MCDMCNGMTAGESLDKTRNLISRFGFTVEAVQGEVDDDGIHPAFAYTIGFTRQGLPEVLLTGRPTHESYEVLGQLGNAVKRGLRLVAEICLTVAGLPLFLLPIPTPEQVLLTAGTIYRTRQIVALQAVWADEEGLFPWEQHIPDDLTQPLYCELPDRWFYCPEHQPPQ